MTSALLVSVLVASLLGSVHCAAMCGPFLAVWVLGESSHHSRGARFGTRASYHVGRFVTYTALGALAGSLGAGIDGVGRALGVSRLAAIASGVLVLWSGVGLIVPELNVLRFAEKLWPRAGKLVQLRTKSQALRGGLLGSLTPLLPCGWLYAFVVTAAGTGSALVGASVMAVFWLGTVPALLGMDVVLAKLSAHVRRRVPLISGLTLIALGLFTIGRRLHVDLSAGSLGSNDAKASSVASPEHHCH